MTHRRGSFADRALACALGLALLAGITSCARRSGAEVVVSAASARTLSIAPAGAGSVQAGVDQAVTLERRATVLSVDVVEGQRVHSGQQLVQASTIGQSAAVTTAVNQLWADEKRLVVVRERDGVSAGTTLALLDQIATERQHLTELKSSPTVVTAPVAGRVSALSVRSGAAVDRSEVILHVVDDRTLRVVVPVAANYRSQLTVGMRAVLSFPSRPGASLTATVTTIGPTAHLAEDGEETVPVTVELSNVGHNIALGSTAYVRFPIERRAAVAVDSLGVLGLQQQPFVFVVDDGRVRQRPVVVGVSDGLWTEISQGVTAGQEIVISGGQRLVDGTPVHISHRGAP